MKYNYKKCSTVNRFAFLRLINKFAVKINLHLLIVIFHFPEEKCQKYFWQNPQIIHFFTQIHDSYDFF